MAADSRVVQRTAPSSILFKTVLAILSSIWAAVSSQLNR